jgi:hypothetical protein
MEGDPQYWLFPMRFFRNFTLARPPPFGGRVSISYIPGVTPNAAGNSAAPDGIIMAVIQCLSANSAKALYRRIRPPAALRWKPAPATIRAGAAPTANPANATPDTWTIPAATAARPSAKSPFARLARQNSQSLPQGRNSPRLPPAAPPPGHVPGEAIQADRERTQPDSVLLKTAQVG